MKTTIKDVAKAAGVSPSTVSRALHNNPRISEEVRQKIRQLSQEMDFHPNQMARSLVNRKSRIIGIVFPGLASESLGHPFYPRVLQGLGQAAAERRYQLLLGTGMQGQGSSEAIRQLVDSGYVSGLILLAAEDRPAEDISLPVVIIGHPKNAENCCYVDNNNVQAGQSSTQYLIERGHRRILFFGYDKQYLVTVDRRRGYELALEENGLPFRREWVIPSQFLQNNTDQPLMDRIFCTSEPPTAVVCMDDAQAIGLTSVLSAMGLSVPRDVSVVSFNNTLAGSCHNPPLTSVDVDPFRLGVAAMEMMLDLIKEKLQPPISVEVPFRLVQRDSVLPR